MADNWTPFQRSAEGVEILEDGTIRLSALRAAGLTYQVTWVSLEGGKITAIKPYKIRLSVAIPLDHRVSYGYKIAGDPSSLPTGKAVVADAADIEEGVIRQHYAQAGQTYQKWLRKDSYPTPASVKDSAGNPTPKAADKLGTAGAKDASLRDDTEYLQHQAERKLGEVGRIQGRKSIFLKGICLQYNPGDSIKDIDGIRVGKVIEEVILHTGNETQLTELVLA